MARILIVDDDTRQCALLSMVLTAAQHEVLTANDGISGLEMAKTRLPDVALLDVNMPGMSGYELCFRLRQDPATRRMPILMLSGMDRLPQAMMGMTAGADDYITKPFSVHELTARVEALLKLRASQ